MSLVKQLASDVVRNLGWILAFGCALFVCFFALAYTTYFYLGSSRANAMFDKFEREGYSFVVEKDVAIEYSFDAAQPSSSQGESEALRSYYGEAFSSSGSAGTFAVLPGVGGFDQCIVLMGEYVGFVMGSGYADEGLSFACLEGAPAGSSGTVQLDGREYELGTVPDDVQVYHPTYTLDNGVGGLSNALFVFSYDYEAVKAAFPDLGDGDLLLRYIQRSPTEEQQGEFKGLLWESSRTYVRFMDTEDIVRESVSPGIRAYRVMALLCAFVTLAVACCLLACIFRELSALVPTLVVHRLHGCLLAHVRVRMFLLAFSYLVLPIASVFAIPSLAFPYLIEYLEPGLLAFQLAFATASLALAAAAASLVERRFAPTLRLMERTV